MTARRHASGDFSLFVDGGRHEIQFGFACFICMRPTCCLSKKKKSIYISRGDWQTTCDCHRRLRSVCALCLRHGGNAGFQRLSVFSLFFIEYVKSDYLPAAPQTHTHTPDTILLPWFNWIKIPNRRNDRVHQVQTWTAKGAHRKTGWVQFTLFEMSLK